MNRLARGVAALAVVAVIGLAGAVTADAAYYQAGIYRFIYSTYNDTNYKLAKSIAFYTGEARRAALVSVAGRAGYSGYIDVEFYYQKSNTLGYTYGGTKLYLNRYWNYTGAKWGSVLAHETSHIYFFQYTGARTWTAYSGSARMLYYSDFITESLAFYAGDVIYRYGDKYSISTVKAQLKYQYNKNRYTVSFYGTGYYYRNGGTYFNQAWWQLHAQGYYFANGAITSYYSRLSNLMYYFRYYSQWSGYYLRSSNFSTAQSYFEYAFYQAYGKRANAGWIYTGTSGYKNTSYLYGVFWYTWYN
jgi:hypothetical protein